jgi:photosystem II stability/assembly factor-like uncharacterized protein
MKKIFPKIFILVFFITILYVYVATGDRIVEYEEHLYDVKIIENNVWIVGYYGVIIHSKNGGESFELQNSGTKRALFSVDFIDTLNGWVVGSEGTIIHTTDGGKTWRSQKSNTKQHLYQVKFINKLEGWAVGSYGIVLSTKDGGNNWRVHKLPDEYMINCLSFVDSNHGWIGGEFGVIYHTEDGGRTWIKQDSRIEVGLASGESRSIFDINFVDRNVGFAVGLDGVILRTYDGGKVWSNITDKCLPCEKNKDSLYRIFIKGNKVFSVGARGSILFSEDRGDNWAYIPVEFRRNLNSIDFNDKGLGIIVGDNGMMLKTTEGGSRWRVIKLSK